LNFNYTDELPKLLATKSFLHSSLSQLEVKSNSKRSRQIIPKLASAQKKRAMEDSFCLEITGPLLPLHVVHLCELFQTTQKGKFSVSFKTVKSTSNLNYFPQTEGAKSKQNKDNEIQQASCLGKQVVKKVVAQKDGYLVTPSLKIA
jgi:hypothetical protein